MNSEIAFFQFAAKHRSTFRRIAAATRRELEPDEVRNEAWLLATEWELSGIPTRFDDRSYVKKLFSYLYQRLVRWTDKKIRNSVRLDHWIFGDNPESDAHPLLNKLASAEESQPLQALLLLESAKDQTEPSPHETRASAYLHLVHHYKSCIKDVANHLMISRSYCYYRLNEAAELADKQHALPDTIGQTGSDFLPGPWRSFRLHRRWVQMELDLIWTAPLWEEESPPHCQYPIP